MRVSLDTTCFRRVASRIALVTAAVVCLGGISSIAQVPNPQLSQNSQAQSEAALPAASQWAEQVVLGSSTVELNGPWKFHQR